MCSCQDIYTFITSYEQDITLSSQRGRIIPNKPDSSSVTFCCIVRPSVMDND